MVFWYNGTGYDTNNLLANVTTGDVILPITNVTECIGNDTCFDRFVYLENETQEGPLVNCFGENCY